MHHLHLLYLQQLQGKIQFHKKCFHQKLELPYIRESFQPILAQTQQFTLVQLSLFNNDAQALSFSNKVPLQIFLLSAFFSTPVSISEILLLVVFGCSDSGVSISEEMRELTTYPFSEPNPIPILTQDKRLYPYHKFVGYSHDGIPKKWKVIKMENEHI